MGRKIHKTRTEAASIDMTPMIDVVFQLMIFFIVTMKMTKDVNPDIKLELTKDSRLLEKSEQALIVEVDRNGMVSSHNARMDRETFRTILKARYNRVGEFPVLIRGDRRTKHRDIRAVMDICADIGLWRLTFVGIKEKKTRT